MLVKSKIIHENFFRKGMYTERNIRIGEKRAIDIISLLKSEDYIKNKDVVLDAGCGNGKFSVAVKELIGSKVVCTDFSQKAIKIAKSKGLDVRKADLEKKLPFKKNFFDKIISFEVLEHLYDPDAALTGLHAVLKKDGFLILSTPNLASWYNRLFLLFGIQPYYVETSTVDKTVGIRWMKRLGAETEPVGHVRIFTLTALKDILKLHGFNAIRIFGLPGPSLPRPMIYVDRLLESIPSLASDLLVIAKKD